MSDEGDEYAFECPECGERLEVNAAMKEALVERGCVICAADVTESAFTPTTFTE